MASPGERKIDFLAFRLILIAAATFGFVGLRLALQGLLPTYELKASDLTAENILSAVNRQRDIRNLTSLNPSAKLALAADGKARDMRDRNYFAHIDPDGNYIWMRIEKAGYAPYAALGENLAIDFFSTDSLIEAWINSPTHRANLLNQIFQDQGVGLALGSADADQHATSIVNAFGKLALKTSSPSKAPSPAQAPAPIPAPSPAPKPKTPPPATPTPTTRPSQPLPSQPSAPQTQEKTALGLNFFKNIFTRGPLGTPPAPDLSKPQTEAQQADQTRIADSPTQPTKSPAPTNPYQAYRKWILAGGAAILIILLLEIGTTLKRKLFLPHRTLNNLVMIIITLLVAALVYWF